MELADKLMIPWIHDPRRYWT